MNALQYAVELKELDEPTAYFTSLARGEPACVASRTERPTRGWILRETANSPPGVGGRAATSIAPAGLSAARRFTVRGLRSGNDDHAAFLTGVLGGK